jgi:hypothetical protein
VLHLAACPDDGDVDDFVQAIYLRPCDFQVLLERLLELRPGRGFGRRL